VWVAATIYIYEDNNGLRQELEELLSLSGEFVVAGSFDNCLQVAEQIKSNNPDVILMDIEMPRMSGIEAVRQIRSFNRSVLIVMLTAFDDNTHIFDAICAGASGYLLKKQVSERLVPAIREVLAEGATLSPSVAKTIIASIQQSTKARQYDFTKKEREILALLCKGNSYKMIAAKLKIPFETVRSYIKKIYDKLQVHSATEAVSKTINERLL
jgi:DNA-binding NarL/FixJ family response regulator